MLLHVGEAQLHHLPRAVEAAVKGLLQVVDGVFQEGMGGADGGGVVDQHVNGAKGFRRLFHKGLQLVVVGYVCDHG